MTITSSHLYKTTLFAPAAQRSIPAAAKTEARRPATPVVEMPASLWRHTQNEEATETSHHRTAGQMLVGAAILSLGSVAYALYQTGALLSGSRLHDAVAAFLR